MVTRAGANSIESFFSLYSRALGVLAINKDVSSLNPETDQRLKDYVEIWKEAPIGGVAVLNKKGVVVFNRSITGEGDFCVIGKVLKERLAEGKEGKLDLMWPERWGETTPLKRQLAAYSPLKVGAENWYLGVETPIDEVMAYAGPIYIKHLRLFYSSPI